jgi:uncharacterized coiled-coil protein SlyX
MANPGTQPGPDLSARLTRVEEACGFAQHDVEQLSAEVAELGRRLAEALRRVESLERRLAAGAESDVDPTPARPPHSAGPAE